MRTSIYRLKSILLQSNSYNFAKMPGNVEIKAKVEDINELRKRAAEISNQHFTLDQCDVFFGTTTGCRLKLRREDDIDSGGTRASLIAYDRPDVTGPKFSNFIMSTVTEPETMEKALAMSNGILGKVEKRRDAYIVKRNGLSARVHLDVVKDLGDFLEFEVIVEESSQMEEAHSFAKYLSDYFSVTEEDTLAGAYWNMLQKKE